MFFKNGELRDENNIINIINDSDVFSNDPEGKKTQLLLQNLSDYKELSGLLNYCKPAIDYHIIRVFLRRGLVRPLNSKAKEFILNPSVQRREQTVAALRKICAEVFENLKWVTSFDIATLNTIEWWIGRSICKKESPDCELESDEGQWLKHYFDRCPYYDSCCAIQNNDYLNVAEPNYQGNSY
jgi:adenine-specific DNA glycosylase